MRLTLTGADFPGGGATIVHDLPTPVPAGRVIAIAWWDDAAGDWVPVDTTLSPDRRRLTAMVSHFSSYDLIYWDVGDWLTKRTSPPSCGASQPVWLESREYTDDMNSPILWCSGRDSKNPKTLVVKVRNNRAYGVAVEPAATPLWTWSSMAQGAGPESLLKAGVQSVLDLPDRLESTHGVFFLPPGMELDLGFSEAQARDVTPTALVDVSNDPTWLVGGLLYDAVDAATEDGYGAVLFALVSVLQCGKDLTDRVFSLDPAGAIADVLTCAGKNSDLLVKRYIQVAQGSGSQIAKTAVVLQRVLKVMAAAQLGAWIGEVLSDRRIDAAARKFFAYPKAPPVGAFAGTWHVHGATLVVSRLGKGSIHNNIGPCSDYSDGVFPGTGQMCNEVPLLDFSLSADGKVLTATVTKVKYQTWEGRWLPDFHPQDAPSWPKGSAIRWHLINPHLLSTRVPVTHPLIDLATQGDGNPLWCGKSATPEELLVCN